MEQHFGLRLFSRTTRSLMLTPEGRNLLERRSAICIRCGRKGAAATRR
ncbi:hypothetical protein [Caballeronia pedi]|nr:hypothetical protein [Caballeronia pedi]